MVRKKSVVSDPNWENRTLFHGDNLDVMRSMNSGSVDLIATDPPFNKGRDFHATPNSLAAGVSFQDRWSWKEDVHQSWVDLLENDYPQLLEAIESARYAHSDAMGAYICFMSVRLIEMRRLLKPTGSIYLHCDPTASHYLKAVMDAIFGTKNFINEIVWHYRKWAGGKYTFQRNHDIILFYSKSETRDRTFNQMFMPRSASTLRRFGTEKIVSGRDEKGHRIPSTVSGESEGVRQDDVWDFNRVAPIKQIYPTQKPLPLYKRIIEASSNKGDIVLDPFAGCATTCVAAEGLNRQWVGIDIWEQVTEVVISRLESEGLFSPNYTVETEDNRQKILHLDQFHFTSDLPMRTDNEEVGVEYLPTILKENLAPWQRMPNSQKREELAAAQAKMGEGDIVCAGCGRELPKPYMELDHINPKSDIFATDDISNRILLCGPCNRKKSDRITLRELLRQNKRDDFMFDEKEAESAQRRALNRVQEIKRKSRT